MTAYDDEIWRMVADDLGPPPEELVAFVRDLPLVEHALDLGCGDGRLTAELRAGRVTAADVSAVALERARRRLPGGEVVHVEPDAPLPFRDATFELVLLAETIEHVRDVQLLLSEARRVLVPRGLVAVTTPAHSRLTGLEVLARGFERRFDPLSPHVRFFTRRGLARLFDEMGFDVVSLARRRGTLLAVARR
jgi:ubiquinone/menaquinone biosynthesis C-methylase UbiE